MTPLIGCGTPNLSGDERSVALQANLGHTMLFAAVCDLALRIGGVATETLSLEISPEFERKSTVIRLRGAGDEGIGEDVTYDAGRPRILQAAGPTLALAGD